MFTETLNQRSLSSSRSIKYLINPEQPKCLDLADLQFELCSNFLKLTKEKLYQQEAELLVMNSALIDRFNQKAMTSSSSFKDVSSQDTTTFSFQGQQQEDNFSQSCRSMLILRKSKSTTCMRRSENDFSLILNQVHKKCSQRTSQAISNLFEQNRRLKEKTMAIEKKKKQVEYEKEQEEMFLQLFVLGRLKKKATEYDRVINSMHTEIAALKMRLKQTQSTLKRSKSPIHDLNYAVSDSQVSAKQFLTQKELIISESSKQLKNLYIQVENKIQEPFNEGSCEKCCQMIKKLKNSILKYRELMEAEANAVEEMYEKFRAKLK